MVATLRRYATVAFFIMLMLMTSVSAVLAQEEVEAVESSGSDGLMIAIIGVGVLIVFGLGAAMNAQDSDA